MEESDLYPPVLLPQTVPPVCAVYLPLGGGAGEQGAGVGGALSSIKNINIGSKFAFGLATLVSSVMPTVGDDDVGGVSKMVSVLTGAPIVSERAGGASAKLRQSSAIPDFNHERDITGSPQQSNHDANSEQRTY
jgi:hypothetical protein